MLTRILKTLLVLLTTLIVIVGVGFWFIFFSERPPLTMDPAVLAGDGSLINYCELPVLDGSGKMAADIPKGNTPGCGYQRCPSSVLGDCREPLPENADDLRGLWIGVEGKVGHVERIEQCGSRVVVTSSGIIHDAGPNSSGGLTSNDTEGAIFFKIGETHYCPRTTAGVTWNKKVLDFHIFGFGPVVVRRYRDGEQLIWEYADGSVTRLNRLCRLPEGHREPSPRGPQYQVPWF